MFSYEILINWKILIYRHSILITFNVQITNSKTNKNEKSK